MNNNYIKSTKDPIRHPMIYLMDIENAKNVSEAYCRQHFPNRYWKALRFHFRDDRNRCICAGVLLHDILQLEETDIRYNEFGKPFADSNYSFSLSHSGKYVALAVNSDLVGVDIERTEQDCLDIMPQIFCREEIAYVGKDKKRFYILWTLKESLSKAVGVGLSQPMTDFSVLPFLRGETVLRSGKRWSGTAGPVDDGQYILSCVCESKEDIPVRECPIQYYRML